MNQVFTHPANEQMQVEVILASRHLDARPIYTIRMRYPRPIHGEIMTHRVFGRNARSSRAVPVRTMLDEVRNTPYVPWHWGKNQKGMQAGEDLTVNQIAECRARWLQASMDAITHAEWMMDFGVHKQNPNRLLEPFSWIDTLITSTEWDNFLWLRQHSAAEPHLQDLANLVAQAISEADVQNLTCDDWHLPYITEEDWKLAYDTTNHVDGMIVDKLLKISAARCARISYAPFDGNASYEAELRRYNMLVTSDRVHASPLEHQARPDPYGICPFHWGNLQYWIQARKLVPNEVYHG